MLTEIALTPNVFEHDSNPDAEAWHQAIRALARRLLDQGARAWVVPDLHGGSWLQAVAQSVSCIPDAHEAARVDAKMVLRKLKEVLVRRRPCTDWPDDEMGWLQEISETHQHCPITRGVVSQASHIAARERFPHLDPRGLADLASESIWDGVIPARSPEMRVGAQVELLRPVCFHAGFLALQLPDIRERDEGDTRFALEIIRSAFARPDGYDRPAIDIHTPYYGDGAALESQGENHSFVRELRQTLGTACRRDGDEIQLFIWRRHRRFIDRWLHAGEMTTVDGQPRPRLRWSISFTHTARPTDRANAQRPVFTLLTRAIADEQYRWLYHEIDSKLLLPPVRIGRLAGAPQASPAARRAAPGAARPGA